MRNERELVNTFRGNLDRDNTFKNIFLKFAGVACCLLLRQRLSPQLIVKILMTVRSLVWFPSEYFQISKRDIYLLANLKAHKNNGINR